VDWSLLGALLKLAGAAVIGVPLAAYLMQDKLIFLPQPNASAQHQQIAASHPNVDDIFLQASDGTRLHAWRIRGKADAPLVIYFGGNAENVAWLLDELPARDTGAAWLLVDYRGYGSSAGAPSERALDADATLWYDFAAKETSHIFAFGRSLGSGVAVHLASESKRWHSSAPLLCIVGTHDNVIPAEHARRLYDAWAGPKQWTELAAGHNDIDGHPRYWPSVQAFLAGR
jgi:pimeloyl-ACP methyl ester carboxylesterase